MTVLVVLFVWLVVATALGLVIGAAVGHGERRGRVLHTDQPIRR